MPDTENTATAAEAQETEALGHYITAELCGKSVEIIPGGAWRQTAMRKLREGDFDAFFEDVMSPDSYEVYLDLDPTNDEIGVLMDDVGAAGEPVGKSRGPRRSSRSTRKR